MTATDVSVTIVEQVFEVTIQEPDVVTVNVVEQPVTVLVDPAGTAERIAYNGSGWSGTKPTNVKQALDLIDAGGIGGAGAVSSVNTRTGAVVGLAEASDLTAETARATAAEAAAQAYAVARAHHTGTQLLATISDAGTAASHAATDFDTAGAASSALATAESYADGKVATEATARAAADTTNANAIAAETTRATAAEGTNATAITNEAATRATADSTNATAITTEATARATAVTSEANTRAAADTTNANAITAEASTARAAESANATAITTETSRAQTAEGTKLAKASGLADLTSGVDIVPPATTNPNGNTHVGARILNVPGMTIDQTIDMTKGPIWCKVAAGSNGVDVTAFAGAGTLNVDTVHDLPTVPAGGQLSVAVTGGRHAIITYTAHTSNTFTGCSYVSGANVGDTVATNNDVQTVVNSINTDSTLATALNVKGEIDANDYDGGTFGGSPYTTTTTVSGLTFPRGTINVETLYKAKTAAGFAALTGLAPVFQNAVSVVNQHGVATNLYVPEGFVETPTILADSELVATPGIGSVTFGAPGENQGWHLGFWSGLITATTGVSATTLTASAASYESGFIIYTISAGKTLPAYAQRATISGFSPSGYNLASATLITPLDSTHFMVAASDPGSSPATGTGTVTLSASLAGLQEDSYSAHLGVSAGVQAWIRYAFRAEDATVNAAGWLGESYGLLVAKLSNDGRTFSKHTGAQTNVGILNAGSTVLHPDAPLTVAANFTLTALQAATSHVTLIPSPDTTGTVSASSTAPLIDGPWRYDVHAWSRVSASSFEVRDASGTVGAGDVTAQFPVGRRLRWTQQAGLSAPPYNVTTVNATVTGSSFNSGTNKTTVTFSGGSMAIFSPFERQYLLPGQQITLVNGGTTANLSLPANSSTLLQTAVILTPGQSVTLLYNPTVGRYISAETISGPITLNAPFSLSEAATITVADNWTLTSGQISGAPQLPIISSNDNVGHICPASTTGTVIPATTAQRIALVNASTNASLQVTSSATTGLKLNSATITLRPGGMLTLVRSATLGLWVQEALGGQSTTLTDTGLKPGSYTANVGERVQADASSSNPTIAAPASPANGDRFAVVCPFAPGPGNMVTVTGPFITGAGIGPSSWFLSVQGEAVFCEWSDARNAWVITAAPTHSWAVISGGITNQFISERSATATLSNKTLVAPALGTPASGTLTNCTGLPVAGLSTDITTGWYADTHTWVYASASTFTIAGVDLTATFTPGTKISWNDGSVKYGHVESSSFSTNTTVTIVVNTDYTIANAAISAPRYSRDAAPAGFPTWFAYTPTLVGFSANPTSSVYRYRIDGATVNVAWRQGAAGTSNATTLTISLPTNAPAASGAWANVIWFGSTYVSTDNGTTSTSYTSCQINPGNSVSTIQCFTSPSSAGAWTASGSKRASGSIIYEMVH